MVAAMPPDALKKVVAQIPVGRLGKAEEIADLVVYLAGDNAGFFSGRCSPSMAANTSATADTNSAFGSADFSAIAAPRPRRSTA